MTNETEDEIAGDKTAARRQSKTRQFYGFVGETITMRRS
jgi:hypothetical protein